LASQQVVREVRSTLWPQAYANLAAVDALDNSRITAGALNNPIIYTRAAGGMTVSQLITDFGHTTNLIASAKLGSKADEQDAVATKEDVLLAVDQAFYNALQTHAVLRVAEQTVASRQLLSDQVSALTRSKLKSDLDLSFANVNLAQAKLLYLDALNNDKSAMASLSAVLGYPTLQNFDLVNESAPLASPPADIDQLIADALAKRPELLAIEFETESAEKLHQASRDQMLPTISALTAFGDAPIRDDRVYGPYAAVGVNVQIPVFNGFLYPARSREAALRAQASQQRLVDLRNRISRDVRTSWLAASTAFDRVQVSEQLLAQAISPSIWRKPATNLVLARLLNSARRSCSKPRPRSAMHKPIPSIAWRWRRCSIRLEASEELIREGRDQTTSHAETAVTPVTVG
jgi:outer membrane protein